MQPASAAGGGVFGSLGATSKPAQSGGLFGSLGASTTQAQQSTAGGSSLFGTLGKTTTQASTQAAGTGSLLGNMGQPQAQNQTQSTIAQPAVASQSAYFDQLLERGKKRNVLENGTGDLPSLQLGLGDIARKVRNLGTGGPSAEQAKSKPGDTRAQVFSPTSGMIGFSNRH
jgi:nuclear pore complex protein Nup93